MRRLFHAGFVTASAQILAVTAATVAVTIAFRYGLVIPASGAAELELQSAARLLMWISLPGCRHCAHAKPVHRRDCWAIS